MIKYLEIKGFKSFAEEIIELGKLTVLTGLNNSGKSSIIQALRMALIASGERGPYIEGLGGYSELKSKLTLTGNPIDIFLKDCSDHATHLKITQVGFNFVEKNVCPIMQFISADRYGPRVALPLISDDYENLTVGSCGEFSVHYASLLENSRVAPELRHQDSAGITLRQQLNWWMSEVSPGIKLDFDVARRYDFSQLGIDGIRPTNSGFGISYVLPIILCLLTMTGEAGEADVEPRTKKWFESLKSSGGILLVENPEAHLHPKGQTILGRIAAMAAMAGMQIVLETHSDHVIDGIRLAVKGNVNVSSDDIRILYLKKQKDESSHIQQIKIRTDGKLDHWPEGFFDQQSINLRALASK
ncbi:DUF3696 domain-containing protein [Pseudomonas sp.]|uniref:DUF3696 domain-containing protein n=1 Tax=Pseudomonas sp. TaxID=306 RepID=UPI0028AAFF73|nr:DUF3696 domain-containing protein [Pseudomonas sp.]